MRRARLENGYLIRVSTMAIDLIENTQNYKNLSSSFLFNKWGEQNPQTKKSTFLGEKKHLFIQTQFHANADFS